MALTGTELKIKRVTISVDHEASELPFNLAIEGTVRVDGELMTVQSSINFNGVEDLTDVPAQFKAAVEDDYDMGIT